MKVERRKAWQVEKRSSSHEGGGGCMGHGKLVEGPRDGQRARVEGRKEGKGGEYLASVLTQFPTASELPGNEHRV